MLYSATLLAFVLAGPPADGLLRCWRLDESLDGRPGAALTAHGSLTWAAGIDGRSWLGNGTDAWLSTPDAPEFDFTSGAFSICVWVNPHRLPTDQEMLVGKNCYALNQREWGLLLEPGGRAAFYLRRDGWKTVTARTAAWPGKWTHLVATVDGEVARLYVNGRLEQTGSFGRPEAHTAAPLTLGGIDNHGTLMQLLNGALAEAAIYNRALSEAEIAGLQRSNLPTHEVPEVKLNRYPLWDGDWAPSEADQPFVPGTKYVILRQRQPEVDGYGFLHGVALAFFGDRLYATYGHNRGKENTISEEAHFKTSDDGGLTWSAEGVISAGTEAEGLSHGSFLVHDGKLWAFVPRFGLGQGQFPRLQTEAFILEGERWVSQGLVAEGFWPLLEPQRLPDGNWFSAGCDQNWRGAVALSHGDDLRHWDTVHLPVGNRVLTEATAWVGAGEIVVVMRNQSPVDPDGTTAAVCISKDGGRTWSDPQDSNFPMVTSKPYAGVLSTGQRYLLCNLSHSHPNQRHTLGLAVSRPGETKLCRIWRLDAGRGMSYPYAIEHEGKLYVGYSWTEEPGMNQNSAKLAIVPVAALATE